MRSLPCPLWIQRAPSLVALVALLAGCGDGTGSSGNGGSGGSSATGGGGGTTTTSASLAACPVNAEPHVAANVVGPDGTSVGYTAVNVTGAIDSLGIDTPPTFECGSGEAWVKILDEVNGSPWIACFQAPNLVLEAMAGDAAEIAQAVVTHDPAPASVRTVLKVKGAIVVQIDQASYEADVVLPDGITVSRADQVCDSLSDPCQIEGYDALFQAGDQSVKIAAGESGDVGGYRVYVDRYWTAKPSSGCDGGDAQILLSVSPPSPGM